MDWLPDRVIDRLRTTGAQPDFTGTRYELGARIGRGGMATVYLARDRVLERDVAVKVLDDPTGDTDLAERLLSEARVLARLEHPGIVPVHDAGLLADGRPFSVMKLVRGRDLAAAASEGGDLPERLRLFERVCDTVAFAHAHGVIHRDLKPENIMVGPFGEVLVLDWGLAKVQPGGETREAPTGVAELGSRTLTGHGMVLGTPGFMAPEQLRSEAVDARADVFSLGVLLAWLLDPPGAPVSERGGRVPRALSAIVERATAIRPGDRYPSVADLGADVRRHLDGLAVSAHDERTLERLGRFARRHRVAIALLAAYLVMRIGLFVLGRL